MWRRLAARLVDAVAVTTWVFALSIAHVFFHLPLWSDDVNPEPWGNWFLLTITLVVVYAAYEIAFIAKVGATPGKDLMNLQVVDATTGQRPTIGQAVRRWLPIGLVQPIPAAWVGGLFTLLFGASGFADPERRTIHDRLANTRVIAKELPDDPKEQAERRQQFVPRFIDPLFVFRSVAKNPRALRRHPADTDR